MSDQVPEEIKSERSAKMIELGHRKQKAYEGKTPWNDTGSADGRGS